MSLSQATGANRRGLHTLISRNPSRPGFSAVFHHVNIPAAQEHSAGHWFCYKSLSCPLAVRNPDS